MAPFLRAFARYAPPHAPRASSRLRWLPLARVCSRWLALLRAVSRWLALARACFPALARASLHSLALARADPQSLAAPLGRAMACSPVPPPHSTATAGGSSIAPARPQQLTRGSGKLAAMAARSCASNSAPNAGRLAANRSKPSLPNRNKTTVVTDQQPHGNIAARPRRCMDSV